MSRLPILSTTERAFAGYVNTYKSGVLSLVTAYAGQIADPASTITPPDIIFEASASEQMGYDSGIYEMKLSACVETQMDESPTTIATDLHGQRVGALRDMLEDFSLIFGRINHPLTGTDSRTVKTFTLSAIVYEDESQRQEDRRMITDIDYYVCASAVNETPVSG